MDCLFALLVIINKDFGSAAFHLRSRNQVGQSSGSDESEIKKKRGKSQLESRREEKLCFFCVQSYLLMSSAKVEVPVPLKMKIGFPIEAAWRTTGSLSLTISTQRKMYSI
jgi:hypothetical protein